MTIEDQIKILKHHFAERPLEVAVKGTTDYLPVWKTHMFNFQDNTYRLKAFTEPATITIERWLCQGNPGLFQVEGTSDYINSLTCIKLKKVAQWEQHL